VKRSTAGVGRRYARALLDVAGPSAAAGVRDELEAWASLLRDHPDLQIALRHPGVPAERKKALLQRVGQATQLSDLMQRLLALLLERDRLAILPDIAAAYVALWNAQRGVVSAELVSATPLAPDQQAAVRTAAARASGKREVELRTQVDESLLGGALLKMEGRTYDGSVRGRLRALGEKLRSGTAGAGRD
jgi:F-type H+-transporting ATPase subunit delta